MTLSSATVCKRLNTLGLPHRTVVLLMDQIQKWNNCNGPEWTVQRIKSLKTDLIRNWSGLEPTTPWVKRHKDGSPKGPFGILFRAQSFKQKVKCLNAMMVYTASYSTSITDNQWKKFQMSAEHAEKQVCSVDCFDDSIMQMPKPRGVRKVIVRFDDIPNSNSKRVPLKTGKSCPESEIGEWFIDNADNCFVRKMVSVYKESLPFDTEFHRALHKVQAKLPDFDSEPSVGKISFIQEAGFKLRAVANPNRIVQLALKPLQEELFSYLREIEEDCTYDQDKGVRTVLQWLQEDNHAKQSREVQSTEISSIDLSDATNNFPLDLQIRILRKVFPHLDKQIDLFYHASTGPWLVKDPHSGDRILRWNKGQPLGLGPSFASFALAHHVVMREAIRTSPGCDTRYVILGDDIVIRDINIAKKYKYFLSLLRCPISLSKTLTSNEVCEFAGKVITKDGVISPIRFNEISDRSFVDVAKQLGPRSLDLFRPRQRAILRKISSLPEEFGGLGWNPLGISYEQRVRDGLNVIRMLESENLRSLTKGGNAQYLRLLLGLNIPVQPFSEDEKLSLALNHQQSRVPTTYSSTLERLANLFNYKETKVPESIDLPGYKTGMVTQDPRGLTTLNILEMKLHQIRKVL